MRDDRLEAIAGAPVGLPEDFSVAPVPDVTRMTLVCAFGPEAIANASVMLGASPYGELRVFRAGGTWYARTNASAARVLQDGGTSVVVAATLTPAATSAWALGGAPTGLPGVSEPVASITRYGGADVQVALWDHVLTDGQILRAGALLARRW
ncbi:MAG: hypothetical protein ACTH4Y_07970 [Microbacterium gubbeenense]